MARPSIVLVVPREAAGARLDRFLASALAAMEDAPSRAELQRWIEHHRVTVNGTVKKASDPVREGAQIAVDPEAPPRTSAVAEEGIAFEILHVDAQIVVVNKPAGLVVHPAKGHTGGTLVNGLLARGVLRAIDADTDDAEGHARPGIVHRLDKGTSGVMVVAKTARAREKLKAEFAAHTIEREYEAICAGLVKPRTFDTLHGRHPKDRLKFSARVRSGKRAVTHVTVREAFALATHVTCRLETGRTHQIRVHLSEGGNPIVGDPLYGKPPKSPALRAIADALGHQALHARLLGFTHPTTGKHVRFEAPPPTDFQLALAALGAMPR